MRQLLDLPLDELEEVLSYCVGSLRALTECNHYLKDFIEQSPILMQHIKLKVEKKRDCHNMELDACFNSSRRYRFIEIRLYGENENFLAILNKLIPKNAECVRSFDLHLVTDFTTAVEALKCLKFLTNVEILILNLFDKNADEEINGNLTDFTLPEYKFEKLTELELTTGFPIVFEVFQNCKTIKTLKLYQTSFDVDMQKFYSLLISSREFLRSLSFENDLPDADLEDENVKNKFDEILSNLNNLQLNLESIDITLPRKQSNENIAELVNFLKLQNVLKMMSFVLYFDGALLNSFSTILSNGDVKELDLSFRSNNSEGALIQPWQLKSLQKLHLYGDGDYPGFVNIIFHSPSYLLTEIYLYDIDLNVNGLATIARNYPNLTRLNMLDCRNYSSDDIFLILKYLKKLTHFDFRFPTGSPLNNELFVNNGDLTLPNIRSVSLVLNELIDNFQATDLMQFIKSTAQFHVCGIQELFVEIIIVELENHRSLHFYQYEKPKNAYSIFQQIQLNVHQFNKHPNQFRVNGKSIDFLLEEDEKESNKDDAVWKKFTSD